MAVSKLDTQTSHRQAASTMVSRGGSRRAFGRTRIGLTPVIPFKVSRVGTVTRRWGKNAQRFGQVSKIGAGLRAVSQVGTRKLLNEKLP